MENTSTELNFFKLLTPELRIVCNISLTINLQKFMEYTDSMNLTIIQQSSKNDRLFTYLPLALMYKNEEMTTFIYNIIQNSGYEITKDNFKNEITDKNGIITTQSGGGKLTEYLYGIGIIIFAIFYDYYIITNGSWDRLSDSINQVQDLSSRIKQGCSMEYRPSKTISLLARGTKDPSFIYSLEYTMQCLSTPTILSAKLQDLNVEEHSKNLLSEMQQKFKELPGFPELPEPSKMSTQLVPFGENPEEISEFLNTRLLVLKKDSPDIDLDDTINNFKLLADMSSDEFKKVFEIQKEQSIPVPSPTQAPTYEYTISLASDIIGAFTEFAPTKFSPSFSFQNVFLWGLQDTIRDTIRKIEDGKRKTSRDIEDLITNATRVFSDISSLPYIISFLFFLNLAAIRSFILFAKKLRGIKESPKNYLQIEDVTEENNVTPRRSLRIQQQPDERGGNRRKTHKQKHKRRTRKHIKKRQTKGKKVRRVTRKR